jgi:integrase/recombinase XerD
MLTIYRRHKKACGHRHKGRRYRGCRCPIWVDGFLAGKEMRESLDLCDWQKAQDKVREWEAEDRVIQEVAPPEPKTLQSAWESFIADGTARGLRERTIKKYGYFRKRMETFAKDRGLRFLIEFNVETLTQFRATWNSQNLSALKKLELLRAFFQFCQDQEWIDKNPARKIKNPKITHRPTLPFTEDEVLRILVACDKFEGSLLTGLRLRALMLLLRFSGLRIGDAVTLARNRIQDEKLFLYTAKTGTPVYVPLPDVLLRALDVIVTDTPYYFWTGQCKPKTAISDWQCKLAELFSKAKVENGHAHRFRDTFAVELLLKGVPIERVSRLLGHQNIRVTEKHYAPWVRARQEQLEDDVRRTWNADSLASPKAKAVTPLQ